MKPTVEQLENLLDLRREERPEEGYWEDFLSEFHHNPHEQVVKQSGLTGSFRRFTAWLMGISHSKWACIAGLAYTSVTVITLLSPRVADEEKIPVPAVNYQIIPASPAPAVKQLDQSPATQGSDSEKIH